MMRDVNVINDGTLQEIDTAVQSVDPEASTFCDAFPEASTFCDAVGRVPESWNIYSPATGVFVEAAPVSPEG